MADDLECKLEELKGSPDQIPLELEPAIWRAIQGAREARRERVAFSVRALSVICALGTGVAGGGVTAAALAGGGPTEVSAACGCVLDVAPRAPTPIY